jgi:hypothetical protein
MDGDDFGIFLFCFLLGVFIVIVILSLANPQLLEDNTIYLSQETGDKICQDLAINSNYSNYNITAESKKGELICNVPSYDNTQLIKFKDNTD